MEKRKRGRPAYKPTAAQRRSVEQMRACGEASATIARALGIDIDTLNKHFADEIANGISRRRAEVIEMLFKAARKGNVTAQKHLSNMTGLTIAEGKVMGDEAAPEEAKPERAPKIGKKEAAQQAADNAGLGTDWGEDLQVGGSGRPN